MLALEALHLQRHCKLGLESVDQQAEDYPSD
jgi:hypothetical protein